MKHFRLLPLAAISLLAAACSNTTTTEQKTVRTSSTSADTGKVRDWHTLSNTDSVTPKHLALQLNVDFGKHRIGGTATWNIENKGGAKHFILDTDGGLTIDSVRTDGAPGSFYLDSYQEFRGRALHIPVAAATKQVQIFYRAADSARALKWLTPQQTGGKKHPFLYTQSEATHARTWIPCPDGPGIRFTYEADVTVPKELLALMSAENPQQRADSGRYHFKMTNPVPAYLMALAVGDLRFESVDGRTGVYAEPDMIAKARWELADVGKMVDAAEALYGPYRWGRYDVLILPPSFPIGGMENPKLTFSTPTIIAGDRSLTNLIAHELAHNWSGNLVTSATWNDIWMNEGFTVYFERRITEALMGASYVDMLWELGYQDLEAEVEGFGKDSRATWLKQDVNGHDAEECLSDVAYEKGSLFLWLVEKNVGREKFDAFLKDYFNGHAFQSITTEAFLAELRSKLIKGDQALEQQLTIDAWVYGPGIPANAPRAAGERFKKVDAAREAFVSTKALPDAAVTKAWTTHEWLHFLRKMPKPLSMEQMSTLDKAYRFTASGNSEIADLWFVMAVAADYRPAFPAMEQFLSRVGRQKFLEPVYGELMRSGKADMAKSLFAKYRANYHPIAQQNIGGIVSGRKK